MHLPSTSSVAAFALLFLPVSVLGAPTANQNPRVRDLKDARRDTVLTAYVPEVVPDSYLIVFKKGLNATTIAAHEAGFPGVTTRRSYGDTNSKRRDSTVHHHNVGHKYSLKGFHGYHVEADDATIAAIAASPDVAYVERNAVIHVAGVRTNQAGSNYNLARLSHRKTGFSNYVYDSSSCAGTRAYVVDSGIFLEHDEFGGRAVYGANFATGTVDTDENGHGTHVSGILGGKTFGVCKENKLVSVKIVDAAGRGTYAGVIAGIEWAVTDAAKNGVTAKSVINLSIAGPFSAAVNSAVAAAVAAGISVIVAAGNEGVDAINDSPGSTASAITVGSIDSTDVKDSLSNFGSTVDVFAPGVQVLSAYIGSTSATQVLSGTSMAAPLVAGLASYFIALEGFTTPAEVTECILTRATKDDVTSAGVGSPNLIAYNGSGA